MAVNEKTRQLKKWKIAGKLQGILRLLDDTAGRKYPEKLWKEMDNDNGKLILFC